MVKIFTVYTFSSLLAASGGIADVPSRSAPVAR